MSGGLAVISDLPKTLVFRICRWVNEARGPTIPQNTIDKPPSAELRPDQKDTDSLPDYDVLDDMLERYVAPEIDPAIDEALRAFIARRMEELPDADY